MHFITIACSFFLFANAFVTLADDQALHIDLGDGESLELVKVNGGSFLKGSPTSELGREADEQQHTVTLTKDFWIAKTPVTVGQFRRFVSETKYKTEAETGKSGGFGLVDGKIEQRPEINWSNPGYPVTDRHPVSIVTVSDAIAFNEWFSKKSGLVVQLPSESQWEFACRGGTTTRFYSGDSISDLEAIAWFKNNSTTPMPVAQKMPNSLGLFDMCGNVYQWCGDIYGPYSPGASIDPKNRNTIDNEPKRVVLRGGAFTRDSIRCRSAERYRADKGTRNIEIGFRVVSLVDEPSGEITDLIEGSPQANLLATSDNSLHTSSSENTLNSQHSNNPIHDSNKSNMNYPIASWFLYAAFFVFFAFAVIVVLFISFLSKRHRSDLPRSLDGLGFIRNSIPVRISDDGFWLNTTGYVAGSIVYYHYFSSGTRHDSSIGIHDSNEQFVYTGQTPANVIIDRVEEPDDKDELFVDPHHNDPWISQQRTEERTADRTEDPEAPSQSSDRSSNWNESDGATTSDRELLSEERSSGFPPAY